MKNENQEKKTFTHISGMCRMYVTEVYKNILGLFALKYNKYLEDYSSHNHDIVFYKIKIS